MSLALVAFFVLANAAHAQLMAVPDSISVSETGGAIQSFPIAVPPGTAGVVPSLSITYNSQGQNGIVGMGFMLNGLASVGRCPRTFATDGVRGGAVNFDANDRFCLDGQRLIAISGADGANGTEYRTELESFSKVVSFGTAGTGPAWFEVRTKSGQIMQFGNSTDSRVLATGRAEARSWAVNRVADTAGNYMTITYVNDTANGQVYPSRIDYTGNTGASLAPYNSVRFVYNASRTDVLTAYLAGSFMRTTALLTNVQTYAGNDLVSDYRFTYNSVPATNRQRLRTVTLCEGGGSCLPATTIGWSAGSDLTNGFTKTSFAAPDIIPNLFQVHGSGDFNGDGLTDLFLNYTRAEGRAVGVGNGQPPQAWLARGNGTFNKMVLPDADNMPDYYRTFASGDFNGDGLTDFYFHFSHEDGRPAGYPNYTRPAEMWLSNGNGTFTKRSFASPDIIPNLFQVHGTGDFNGDGLTDLFLNYTRADGRAVGVGNGQPPQVWLSVGNGTFNKMVLPDADNMPDYYRTFASGDFNGDGLTDFYFHFSHEDGRPAGYPNYTRPAEMWLSNGNGTFTKRSFASPDIIPNLFQVHGTGDFNGDGLTDLFLNYTRADGRAVGVGNGQPPQVWLSMGNGTFNKMALPDVDNMPDYYRMFGSGDFNGDGLTDFYFHFSYDNGRTAGTPDFDRPAELWTADGDGTFTKRSIPAAISMPNAYRVYGAGDFNGDGVGDLYLHFSHTDGRAAGVPNYTLAAQLWTSPGPIPDLLSTVASGLGEVTSIIYRPMTDRTVYTKDTGGNAAVYPIVDVISSMLITSKIEQTDGVGGLRSSTYRYAGAKADSTGRGFLGFREMTARDEQTSIEQRSVFEQLYPFTLMKKSETRSVNGTMLSNMVNSYSSANLGGTRRRVFLTQSTATGVDLNGASLPSSTTTYQYDDYSNATQIAVTASDGFSKTTTNTYLNDAGNWLLGRLLTANVTSQAPNAASQAPAADSTPSAYDFTDITDASPSTLYETGVNLPGFNQAVAASVSGGGAQIRKNGAGGWATSLTMAPGDRLDLRMTSSSAYGAALTATVTVGGVSANWIVSNSRAIIISSNVNGFNLRTAHDALYPAPTGTETIPISLVAMIEPNIVVGATSTATPAFDVGSWPAGIPIRVVNRGSIIGGGGNGGHGGSPASAVGATGGTAFYTRYPVKLNNVQGNIAGGGGGGGGGHGESLSDTAGGGGGGAGVPGGLGATGNPNAAVRTGAPGTTLAGGNGGSFNGSTPASGGSGFGVPGSNASGRSGGGGGGPGAAGGNGAGQNGRLGGQPGMAVDGAGFVTYDGAGGIWGAGGPS